MKHIAAAKFKETCLALLDEVDPEGIVITKRGKPVARLIPFANLDTHVLLFAVTGALRPREQRVLRADQWSISAIVLWEIARLAQLGRITVDLEHADVIRVLSRIHVWPLTREISHASTRLDVKGDPAEPFAR